MGQKSTNILIVYVIPFLPRSSGLDGLLKEAAYINGKWIHSTKSFGVFNPFNGELIAKVPNLGEVECEEAIDAAYEVRRHFKWLFYSFNWIKDFYPSHPIQVIYLS